MCVDKNSLFRLYSYFYLKKIGLYYNIYSLENSGILYLKRIKVMFLFYHSLNVLDDLLNQFLVLFHMKQNLEWIFY